MRQTVGILGTPLDVLDMKAVLARLEQFIQEQRFHQVATANTDFVINALEDPELRFILRNADLVIPDGMPLVWASRLMRCPLPERVTGADLVPELAALSAGKGYRIFMLGARPEVAQRAQERLLKQHPTLKIVGCLSPPVAPLIGMDHRAILEQIHRACPDILLVAFGNPKQEKWIHLNREGLRDVPVCIGVGGTFDFIAGEAPRAPQWMQRTGLEWVHRLQQEPRRLGGRYARDLGHFSRYLFRQWSVMRAQHFVGTSEFHTAQSGQYYILSVVGDMRGKILREIQAAAEEAFEARMHVLLDLQKVSAIDSEALGMLINLPKRAAYYNLEMRLAGASARTARLLERSQLQEEPYHILPTHTEAMQARAYRGLSWQLHCGSRAALLELRGNADARTTDRLEQVCQELLDAGKRVDLDFGHVGYVDLNLLVMLMRLADTRSDGPNIRVIPGDTLQSLLRREKAADRLTLLSEPELPPDIDQAADTHDRIKSCTV